MIQQHDAINSRIIGSASSNSSTNCKERIDPDHVDAMLAAELNQMTFQEREKINEELHGVDNIIDETEELVTRSLQEMDFAIPLLPNNYIYYRAKNINSRYVEDPSFRLMFLRSDYFNPQLAAKRLIKFLENKVRFFGEETLARPIYLSDLNNDDMNFLKSGSLQLIPARDRSGRVILANFSRDDTMEQLKDICNYVCHLSVSIMPPHLDWQI
jgi:hypothetical protein